MKKVSGFTFIELILTLVLTTILAGIVVEIIAGPIRSYFWVTTQTLKVENAELVMSNLERDLQSALSSTVQIENTSDRQQIIFQKVLYEGLIIPTEKAQTKVLTTLGAFGQSLDMDKTYQLYFPLKSNSKFYQVKIKDKNNNGQIILNEDLNDVNTKPMPFYLVSHPITFECTKDSHIMERSEDQDKALLSNLVQNCSFSMFQEAGSKGIFVAIVIDKGKNASRFSQPILFEKMR